MHTPCTTQTHSHLPKHKHIKKLCDAHFLPAHTKSLLRLKVTLKSYALLLLSLLSLPLTVSASAARTHSLTHISVAVIVIMFSTEFIYFLCVGARRLRDSN